MLNTTLPTHLADTNNYTINPTESNDSSKNDFSSKRNIFFAVMYSLTFILGVTGNGLVIFITGFRMKKTVNTVWFLNLAIADFIFTLFLPFSIVYFALDIHWLFGLAMCKLHSTITVLNMYASVYFLMVISIDRCISVRLPVWAQNHRTPRLASFVVLGVWILALVLSSPKLYFRQIYVLESKKICFDNYSSTEAQAQIIHRAVITLNFTFAFVIPFGIIICSYGAVILRLQRNKLSPSNKPFKVITAVIVAFFVCWLPFHIFAFMDVVAHKKGSLKSVLGYVVPLSVILAHLNSCLNPILYVFMGHDFKEQLRRSLFSTFENAFAEQSHVNTTDTKSSLMLELESQKP